jgi:hypothetical protein
MRTSRAVLFGTIASLGILLTSCSSSSSNAAKTTVAGATTTAAGATTSAGPITRAGTATTVNAANDELKKLLLTLPDLPTGWSIDPSQSNPDDTSAFSGCPSLNNMDKTFPSTARANIDLTKSTEGPFAGEKLQSYSGDNATKGMAALRPAAAACTSIKSTAPDGTVYDLTMAEMSFPAIGDESVAFQLTGNINTTPVDGQFVYARKGNLVSAISAVAVNGNKVDLGELQKITEAAVAKLP